MRAYNRTGRGRLQADTRTKAGYAPKGMVLVTGEDVPNIGQSGTARMISIEMKNGDVDHNRLTELQNQTDLLNQAMRNYIEWLQPQMGGLGQRFKSEFNHFRQQVIDTKQHGRLIEAVVWLHMGFNMFMEYAVAYAAISSEQAGKYKTIAWNEFLSAAKEQAKVTEEDNPVTKFINALNEMIATKTVRVTSIVNTDIDLDNELYTESIGYYDREFYYLLPEKTYGSIVEFYKEQGARFPVGVRMLWKHLKNKKLIVPAKDSPRKQKKINGKNDRYIWLYKSALEIPDEA